jgi:hypothetical protein
MSLVHDLADKTSLLDKMAEEKLNLASALELQTSTLFKKTQEFDTTVTDLRSKLQEVTDHLAKQQQQTNQLYAELTTVHQRFEELASTIINVLHSHSREEPLKLVIHCVFFF